MTVFNTGFYDGFYDSLELNRTVEIWTGHPQEGGTKLGDASIGVFDYSRSGRRFQILGTFQEYPDTVSRYGITVTPTGNGIVDHVVYKNSVTDVGVVTTCPGHTVSTGVDVIVQSFSVYFGDAA